MITGLPLISIVGTLSGGVLAKKIAPDRVVLIGFALTIVLSFAMLITQGQVVVLFLLFFVMGFVPAGSFAAIPHFNERIADRARATGGIAQLGNVGTTLGTPIFVLAYDGGGLWAIGLLMIAFCAFGILCTTSLRRRIK